jgi:pimeloyl-ACP methyl ester carboxylesterase
MAEVLRANGVDLCVQTFGEQGDPAILLIGGAASSLDWWETEFCERLAAGPRCVIRYDFRDTGQSVSDPPGAPTYTGGDLVADAVGILEALAIERAHLVGVSMGGAIAQQLAIEHRDRVASLTLISTSPGGPGSDLPPPADHVKAAFADPPPDPDWTDRAAVIDSIIAGDRLFAGSLPYDEPAKRALVGQIVDRTRDIAASMTNHWILDSDGAPTRPRLGDISAPTLVLHGTEDPLFPFGHGEALAAAIPGARLIALERVGHEFPPRAVWDIVVPAILAHTA